TKFIDLRSDTLTLPSPGMRAAMANAEVGDDVYGEDPSVNALQERLAGMLGFDAGLFVPTGTQSNLIGVMTHCGRGDEYIVGQSAHAYRYEAGGAAVLGSIQPQPITNQPDGTIALADIEAAIKPDDPHYARTKLLALENTTGGKPLPREYLREAVALAKARGLALHLDGARLFNAAGGNALIAREIVEGFDTVSVCFSKGLGTPAGSVLCGSRDQIEAAQRWRKMLGGGMRQAGVLAAAGLYALDHNVERLAEDHANAARLHAGLAQLPGITVEPQRTNMVFVHISADQLPSLDAHLKARGIKASLYARTRLVTHMDVDQAMIDAAIAAFSGFFAPVSVKA
ncbi:MAG: low-specificity L-threonine aldolase, partial [Casimicrobiaceae bacterium]